MKRTSRAARRRRRAAGGRNIPSSDSGVRHPNVLEGIRGSRPNRLANGNDVAPAFLSLRHGAAPSWDFQGAIGFDGEKKLLLACSGARSVQVGNV